MFLLSELHEVGSSITSLHSVARVHAAALVISNRSNIRDAIDIFVSFS